LDHVGISKDCQGGLIVQKDTFLNFIYMYLIEILSH